MPKQVSRTTYRATHRYLTVASSTGYLFAGLGAVCIVLLWFFIPDFTGRSYAQLDELFLRKIPARKFASTECTGDYGRYVTAREVEEMAGVH